ncbi:MAG TPA: acyltransferase [Bacteroidia bacterium]|nr:acyltransferase [Bacteroidia bacterium]
MADKDLRLNNYDLLRILAAIQVVISHGFHHLGLDKSSLFFRLIEYFPGVPVFFTISGFLISASFEKNPELKNYFTNRALRIFPGLWVCILFSILTSAIVGHVNFLNPVTLPWLIGQFSFVQFFNPDFLRGYGTGVLNGSLWTITVELQFYILLPLLYLVMNRIKSGNIFIWFMLAIFFALAVVLDSLPFTETQNKFLAVTFLPHYYMFLAGMLLQRLNVFSSHFISGQGIFWMLLFLLYCVFVPDFGMKPFIGKLILAVLTIAVAYTLPGLSKKILKGNDWSYGTYIYHMPVMNIIVEKGMTGNYLVFIYALLATLTLAGLSWKRVEEKFIRMKKKSLLK